MQHSLTFVSSGTRRVARLLVTAALWLGACSPGEHSSPVSPSVLTGALDLAVSGLPGGADASITVTGPAGFTRSVTATVTLSGLAAGTYTIAASNVTSGGNVFGPSLLTQSVTVSAGSAHATAAVAYAIATGALAVTVSGLPSGASTLLLVSGPGGFATSLTPGSTLQGLVPGTYTVAAPMVLFSGFSYAASASPMSVTIAAGETPATAAISYGLASGALSLTIHGAPAGPAPTVNVTGPAGYAATVTRDTTITNLAPGTYTVVATTINAGADTYAAPSPLAATITASLAPQAVDVLYALTTGRLTVTVSGLPNGTNASVHVSGPNGYASSLTGTTTLTGLTPGAYTVAASNVSSGPATYSPTPGTQTVQVAASTTPAPSTVTYALATGSLQVTITGLPVATLASVTVTGPGGFAVPLSSSQTLGTLVPGDYTVAAANVTSGASTYQPVPPSQPVTVLSGATASVNVTYAAQPSGPDLAIDGLYITQAVQTYTGAVPLVAGRNGFLRVFVTASQSNALQPTVRVRFYNGATLTNTLTLNAPGTSVPTAVSEGVLSSSWNATIPGSWLQPGITLLADVDPLGAIAEPNESNNAFPVSGTPQSLNVQAVPQLDIRFIPVLQSANGLVGNVSPANKDQYTSFMQKVYPLLSIASDVHATYTTNAPALMSDDANNGWNPVLNEIEALRAADGFSGLYYGVVHTTYTSGVAGLGYVAGESAIGWDLFPSAATVSAHEVGHNFGRWHAPCGGPSSVDASYPYANGAIGVYGYDAATNTLKSPNAADLMGYCSSPWVSDYTYTAVLNYRASHPAVVPAVSPGVQPVLLIWGRIDGGQPVLEPSYDIDARPLLPSGRGASRVEGFDAAGVRLFSYAFDGHQIADGPRAGDETFAFAIPRSAFTGRLTTIRYLARGRQAERRAAGPPGGAVARSAPLASRQSGTAVRLTWSDPEIHGVLVRDSRTGEILSFARGTGSTVHTPRGDVDVILSDGVRSDRRRLAIR